MVTINKSKHYSKKELGINDNKTIEIKKIRSIYIDKFRSITDKEFFLGEYITVVSGKNGTMKSSIMGLVAHPFEPKLKSTDPFGNHLKTDISDVFKLSSKNDREKYKYHINLELVSGDILREPVDFYFNKSDNRFRIVASGRNKGDGNFPLNTSYVNLRRLFPMVNTNSKPDADIKYSESEKKFISTFFAYLLQKQTFTEVEAVVDAKIKTTLGPSNSYYDYESISSGEDNLGHIVNKLIGFMRNKNTNKNKMMSNGIFCIDEFESSLHPVVQIRLFEYLYNWAVQQNVQVIINTHSLYLISHVLNRQKEISNSDIFLNMISTAYVDGNNFNIIKNPTYDFAHKELTLRDFNSILEEEIHKVDILCEDDIAKDFLSKIIKSNEIKKYLNFITNLSEDAKVKGNSYTALASLCINGPKLLNNSLVIFDADVPGKKLSQIKGFNHYLKLPDEEGLALEKRIVKYIIDLPGNDKFFTEFNNEKDKFLADFSSAGIDINEKDYSKANVKHYKNWTDLNLREFKKIITFYVRENEELFTDFKTNFVSLLNEKLKSKSLPSITIR